jgi:ribA/ribD-fused uncharacterized protein
MGAIWSFRGQWAFLSNFFACNVGGYPSAEHAYQATKCRNKKDRAQFKSGSAGQAKRLGRRVKLTNRDLEYWMNGRVELMRAILQCKFSNPELAKRLKDIPTDTVLIEGNNWHDNFWGSCSCAKCGNKGMNNLGQLLNNLRGDLQ